MVQLYNSTTTGVLDETSDVMVVTDGISKEIVPAGGIIEISTGNSITLVPGIYHRFYAKKAEECWL